MNISEVGSSNTNFAQKILPWFVCFIAAIFYCYEFFLRVAPSTMAAEMMSFYKIGAGEFSLLTSFYVLAYTPMQIVVGILMDHYGPRRLLSLSVLCCIAGCVLISIYSALYLGKTGMFLMGFGSAFAFVGVLKLAVNWLPPDKLSLVSGCATALGLLGGIFAETILDMFLAVVTWRHAWFYAGLLGILILVITLLFVKDHPAHKLPKVDDIPNASWKNLFEDLSNILCNYKFILNGLIGGVMLLPISVFANTWANLFFSQAGGFNHQDITTYLVPAVFLGMAVGGPLAGIFSEYLGKRKIIYQISIVLSAILFAIIISNPGLSVQMMASLMLALGFFSGGQILVFVIAVELSEREAAGTAAACTNFLVMLGPVVFIPFVGWLLDYQWMGVLKNDVRFYDQSNYFIALLSLPLCYLVAFLCSFLLDDTHPKARARELAYEEQLLVLAD